MIRLFDDYFPISHNYWRTNGLLPLQGAPFAKNFFWIWLVLKNSRLLSWFRLIWVDLTCYIRPLMHLDFFKMSLHQSFPLSVCSIMRNPPLVILMPKDASISRYVTCWSYFISLHTASILYGTTTHFERPSRNWSSSEHRPQLMSLVLVLHIWSYKK